MVSVYEDEGLVLSSTHEVNDDFLYNNYVTDLDSTSVYKANMEVAKLEIINHFADGAFVEIKGGENEVLYRVKFTNKSNNLVDYESVISNNNWCVSDKKYAVDWFVTVENEETKEVIFTEHFNPSGKRVCIKIDSKSLGDTLAWIPAVEAFRIKHNCTVICSTFMNELFVDHYKEILFVEPSAQVFDLYAFYTIGWSYDADNKINPNLNPTKVTAQPLQKTAYDILGLEYVETKPLPPLPEIKKKKQVAIAIHSTSQAKYWNNESGWQDVVDYLTEIGYKVILVSKESDGYMGNKHPSGIVQHRAGSVESVREVINESELFIGVGSGLAWVAWCTSTPTIIISGFSSDLTEPSTVRVVAPMNVCRSCLEQHRLNAGDWNWCPLNKDTDRQFECSKTITPEMVINEVNELLTKSRHLV